MKFNTPVGDTMLRDMLSIAKREYVERIIGEGNFAYVLGGFDVPLCFKVGKKPLQPYEYEVLSFLYRHNLPVPEPFDFIDNAIAMRVIDGFNLEEAQKRSLKFSDDVKEALADAIDEVTALIIHGDLALRNTMLGDVTIEEGVVVDADAFIIDFGMSTIKPNRSNSREGESFIAQIKRIF